MKVSELIEELKKYPEDTDAYLKVFEYSEDQKLLVIMDKNARPVQSRQVILK
jgi:hypothetical protein